MDFVFAVNVSFIKPHILHRCSCSWVFNLMLEKDRTGKQSIGAQEQELQG